VSTHPVAAVAAALFAQTTVAAAATVTDDPDTVVRVDLGDPGNFAEPGAIGIAIATEETEAITGVSAQWMGSDTATYEILCAAKAWQGLDDDTGRVARMLRAFELVDVVRARLAAVLEATRASGVVGLALIRESYVPMIDEHDNSGALVQFAVRVVATRPQ